MVNTQKRNPLIDVKNLTLFINGLKIINKINFSIPKNKITAIVGESGSGKSITALSLLGLLPKKSEIKSGEINFNNSSLLKIEEKEWRKIRGNKIGMIFQEPQSSLNPSMRCGYQIKEVIDTHLSKVNTLKDSKKIIIKQLEKVKLKNPEKVFYAYPHELSGGQKQRVMIAMALICKPQLLIADEPTTALDIIVQKEIINLLKKIQIENSMSILFISHDLSLVSEIADTVIVMYEGKIVEKGQKNQILKNPKKNYTKALIKSRPPLNKRFKALPTIDNLSIIKNKNNIITNKNRELRHNKIYSNPPILKIRELSKNYNISKNWFYEKSFSALKSINFDLYEGETLGVVGASGCGKSTLGKSIIFLDAPDTGKIYYRNKIVNSKSPIHIKKLRKNIQFIFQDPYAALHPKKMVREMLFETLNFHEKGSLSKINNRINELLNQVGLSKSFFYRYPHELSGGQRQRIVIARALAVRPKILICDESVAALDISVQAKVLNLLNKLKTDLGLSYIFISHDLSIIKYMSDKIIVMDEGKIVEYNEADSLYSKPKTEITKNLIYSIPNYN